MNKRFDFLLRIFIVCVVLLGGNAIFRLLYWSELLTFDRVFYVLSSVLMVFGFVMIFLLRRESCSVSLPDLPPIEPVSSVDSELAELRREVDKVVVPEPVVVPESLSRSEQLYKLETDVSMYVRPNNRNILKDDDDNEYKGVF